MWWLENSARRIARLGLALTIAGLVAGCFQPLYGERSATGGPGMRTAMSGVEVLPIFAPNGTPLARIAVETRNNLLFELTGGSGSTSPTHKLDVKLSSTTLSVIVDINTARPDIENYGLDATYTLVDLASGRTVLTSQTFARVSYDIPGQQQRFARARGLRDAENRAAKVIADQIKQRLASYFVAGT
ncbi:MAG: LPS assembly lipoprotein LptE [Hyphomicrobiales bacterium]